MFIGYYILFSFDDINYSEIIDSFGLTKKCMGDPEGPEGPDPNPYPCADLTESDDSKKGSSEKSTLPFADMHDSKKESHNHPALDNYKQFVEYKDVRYETSSIRQDIINHNNKNVKLANNEMLFEKIIFLTTEKNHYNSILRPC